MQRFRYVPAFLLLMALITPNSTAQPINDRFNTHLPILANAGSTLTYTQSNVGATDDVTPSCGVNARNGIWYAISVFPVLVNGVTFDTVGSNFDTVLTVYRPQGGSLVEVACNDDLAPGTLQSRLEINLAGAVPVYLVQVSGFNGATGNVVFNATPNASVLPPHQFRWNEFEIPTLLPGFSHPSSNFGVPPQPDTPAASCGGSGTNNAYRVFRPSTSGFVTIDTEGSDFDTVLSIESSAATELACNDDISSTNRQSRIRNFEAVAGQTYYMRVTGFTNSQQGLIRINLSSITSGPVSSETEGNAPSLSLAPAFPNPFAGRTTLSYTLDVARDVRLAAFDLLGREVAVLVDGARPAGTHDAVFDATSLPSGTYLLRLTADRTLLTQRVTVLR